jgi:hypothetical protein
MPQLRADRCGWVACHLCNLLEGSPPGVAHDIENALDLIAQTAIVYCRVVLGAVEVRI